MMKILGIETSCDETAAAIVEDGKTVLSSAIATSQKLHTKTGGIIPEVAARKQIESIIPVIQQVLADSLQSTKYSKKNTVNRSLLAVDQIDAIAVTHGPGLIGSLLVGVETAKTLSMVWGKPIIPVNHLVAHIYANWLSPLSPQFPLVALVVSGGHTDFVLMKSHQDIKYIGGTRDDAAGEAFDKTARLLGLPYPGGPSIATAAEKYLARHSDATGANHAEGDRISLFPRPMIDGGDLDMSFSGLKTAVSRHIAEDRSPKSVDILAAEIQEAIVDVLVNKSVKAIEKHSPKSFLLAGGVSANTRLREKLSEALKGKTKVFIPEPTYSTDNAVMIATAAFYNYKPIPWQEVTANPSLSIEE